MVGRLQKNSTLTSLPFFPGHQFGGGIRQTMSPLEEEYRSTYSPVPGHWLGGRHSEDDVSAEEQQLLLAFPSFQDINFVESIRQAMSPLFRDTDWVDDTLKMMFLLKKNNSYSLSRTLILWRVFYYSNVSPVPGHWLGGRHTEDDVPAEEQFLLSFSGH